MALAALGGLAGIPPEVTEQIQIVTEKFTTFLAEFSKAYIVAFVQDKLDKLMAEAASAAFGGVPDLASGMFGDDDDDDGDEDVEAEDGGDDAGDEDGGEEKGGDEENKATEDNGGDDEEIPLAAGITLIDVRLEEGLDYAQHRYYDIAAVAIRPKGSLIRRVTKTHRKLLNGSSELLEAKEAPEGLQFPQKKWGKKDEGFYRSRFESMQEFYDAISNSPVALQPAFLQQFDLLADPKREHRMKMFVEALGDVCKKYSKENDIEIDMGEIMDRAASLGVEADQQELLKVVGIKAIGGPVIEMIKEAAGPSIKDQAPGFMEKMKHGTIKKGGRKAIKSMTVTISGIVRGSYAALGPLLEKVAEGVQQALDKTVDPIIKVIQVLARPLGKGVQARFGGGGDEEPAEEPGDDAEAATEENAEEKEAPEASEAKQSLKRKIEIERYPWVLQLFNTVESGSSSKNALQTLTTQIEAFRHKEDFAGYLVYDFGAVAELNLPFVDAVQDPHEAIVDAVLEVWIVLSQAGAKAMMPLFELHDEVCKEFDPSTFDAKKRNAVRLGGQILAQEYFALPKKLRRALKGYGPKVSRTIMKLAQKTVNLMADSLGVICRDWSPTIPPEVTPSFIEVTKKQAQKFGQKTATRMLTTIQVTTQMAFVNVVMAEMGPVVDEATGAVDEVLSLLPEPINEYFQVGGYCKRILDKMIYKACFMAVARLAKPSQDTFFTGGRVRQTILHVDVSAGELPTSPRMSMAMQAADDDENNTTDEEREDEELLQEVAADFEAGAEAGADGATGE